MNKPISFWKEELAQSLISPELAEKAGVSEIEDSKIILKALKRTNPDSMGQGPHLKYDYYDLFQRDVLITCNVKSAKPLRRDGKDQKYDRPTGDKNYLYYPKHLLTETLCDLNDPLFITEGEKKTICLNDNGFLTIGLNGVWNWKTKDANGVSKALEVWNKIPLKGRQVAIVFDSDCVKNPDVKKAMDELASFLMKLGAKVRIVILPSEGEKKVGIDDYIVDQGVEAFRLLLKNAGLPSSTTIEQIEEYINGIENLPLAERNNKIRTVSYALASKKTEDVEGLVKKIAKASGLKIDTVDKLVSSAKKETNKISHYKVINWDSDVEPVHVFLNNIYQAMLNDGRVFREGNQIVKIIDDEKIIFDMDNIGGQLNDITEIRMKSKHDLLDNKYGRAILTSPALKHLKEITLFQDTFVYQDNWKLCKRGYNEDSKIFCTGKEIKPSNNIDIIYEMLSEVPFKNEASRTNAIGALLTAINRNHWIGEKPFYPITGNQPGLGKSTLADMFSIIAKGTVSEKIGYVHNNEEELEKRICSRMIHSDFLNFDNVKIPNGKEISSGALEKLITEEKPTFRLLGSNREERRTNTFQVFISVNDAKFSKDLITRMCPIELYLPEDSSPEQRNFKKKDIKKWCFEHREEIISALFGIIENWKKSGYPTVKIDTRFHNWSSEVGGMLEAYGIKGFMENLKTASKEYTEEAMLASELFGGAFDDVEEGVMEISFSSDQLVEKCMKAGFGSPLKALASPVKLGQKLSKVYGIKIPDTNGGFFILEKGKNAHQSKRTTAYTIKRVLPE